MSEPRNKTQQLIDDLKLERDELGLQIHLAAQEIRTEWEQLESKWQHLVSHAKVAGDEAKTAANKIRADFGEAVDDIEGAREHIIHDLKQGYRRVRQALR